MPEIGYDKASKMLMNLVIIGDELTFIGYAHLPMRASGGLEVQNLVKKGGIES